MLIIKTKNNPSSLSDAGTNISICPITDDYGTAQSGTTSLHVDVAPPSFLKGLEQCDSGRVVDMDRAMNEPPPSDN